jgi:catechol 2,3-dioxygenase-like lactoylglutathione lyase family enzyme
MKTKSRIFRCAGGAMEPSRRQVEESNMLTKGTHHVSLSIDDLDAAREFYGGLLGLPEIERPQMGIRGTWYQAGAVQLHLIEPPPGMKVGVPEGDGSPIANHIAFEIEDYAKVRSTLEEAGLEVKALGKGVGQMFVRDPHGNTVEFIEPGGRVGSVEKDEA